MSAEKWFTEMTVAELRTALLQRGVPASEVRALRLKFQLVHRMVVESGQDKETRVQQALGAKSERLAVVSAPVALASLSGLRTHLIEVVTSFLALHEVLLMARVCGRFRARLSLSLSGTPSRFLARLRTARVKTKKPGVLRRLLARASSLTSVHVQGNYLNQPHETGVAARTLRSFSVAYTPMFHFVDILRCLAPCARLESLSIVGCEYDTRTPARAFPWTVSPWPQLTSLELNNAWVNADHQAQLLQRVGATLERLRYGDSTFPLVWADVPRTLVRLRHLDCRGMTSVRLGPGLASHDISFAHLHGLESLVVDAAGYSPLPGAPPAWFPASLRFLLCPSFFPVFRSQLRQLHLCLDRRGAEPVQRLLGEDAARRALPHLESLRIVIQHYREQSAAALVVALCEALEVLAQPQHATAEWPWPRLQTLCVVDAATNTWETAAPTDAACVVPSIRQVRRTVQRIRAVRPQLVVTFAVPALALSLACDA